LVTAIRTATNTASKPIAAGTFPASIAVRPLRPLPIAAGSVRRQPPMPRFKDPTA
jgi:hypothetical protein